MGWDVEGPTHVEGRGGRQSYLRWVGETVLPIVRFPQLGMGVVGYIRTKGQRSI